jgi:hypothetical protein
MLIADLGSDWGSTGDSYQHWSLVPPHLGVHEPCQPTLVDPGHPADIQVIINTETATETADLLNKRLFAIKNQRMGGDSEDLALIIDGKSLTFALEKEISDVFLELAIMCKVRCCFTMKDLSTR